MQLYLIRLFNGLLVRIFKTRKICVIDGVPVYVFEGRWSKTWFEERFHGLVTGEIIFVDYPESADEPELIAHEMEHVRQFREWKLLFPVIYFYELFRVGYMDNRYEVAARRASSASSASSSRS